MSRLKLSKTHSIEKSSLKDNYTLEDTHAGHLEHVGTYTECLKIAKGIELKPIKKRRCKR